MLTDITTIDLLIGCADAHREADEYRAGAYGRFKPDGERIEACSIGCSVIDLQRAGKLPPDIDTGDHAALSRETGIPEHVLHTVDRIFEGLPAEDRPALSGRFFRAARGDGRPRDLSLVWPRFAVWLLTDPEHGVQQRTAAGSAQRTHVDWVAALWQRVIEGESVESLREEFRARASLSAVAEVSAAASWTAAWVGSAAAWAAARAAAAAEAESALHSHYRAQAKALVRFMEEA